MKRLVAKTGEYQKDSQNKGEYTRIGVLMQGSDGGEYMLLDPTVNLAGVLLKQNALAATKGGQQRDTVMISVFDDNNQQQGGYGNQPHQQGQQQGGYVNQQQGGFANNQGQQGGYQGQQQNNQHQQSGQQNQGQQQGNNEPPF